MNFQELMQRMTDLERPVTEEPNEGNAFSGALDAAKDAGKDEFEVDGKTFQVKEQEVEGCGDMPGMANMPNGMMGMRNPGQQDSVNMNVSLNAAGSGGIRDLMGILKNIEDADSDIGDPEVIIKKMSHPGMDQHDDEGPGQSIIGQEELANAPDEMYLSHDFNAGADLNRPKAAYPAAQRGDNPMAVEQIVNRLSERYNKIKEQKTIEAAKWRDAEHKGKLYTQEPDDGEGDRHDYYHDSRPENDPGEKRSTFNRNKDTDKLHFPYGDYQVGKKAQVGDRAKKGLLTKNAISVVKNRIKGTSGDHPKPNLPK